MCTGLHSELFSFLFDVGKQGCNEFQAAKRLSMFIERLYDWLLPIDPTNHIQSLNKHA